ncbi:hypothetical protein GPECTOR_37g169 [Gonium pectorale]|uniref:phytol kinase n=1 Tax=Gonium pectorale TaxID=33097 RepID=A0A150GBM4_GONPE|nr:hypothetical protein GPECTOR_37g169 [Gonium pectorale]|eukprot:KXZ47163.1 hypothetical protein GPECTOR_37g169 [Gonium pectorale]
MASSSSSRRAAVGGRAAGGGRARNAEEGARADEAAAAELRAALQSLDEELDQLFTSAQHQHQNQQPGSDSSGPLASASAARLRRLGKALDAACKPQGAAAAILAWGPGRSALLRLLAETLRLPVRDWIAGLAAADGSARHLRASVARQTLGAVSEVVLDAIRAAGPAFRPAQPFLRTAVRAQALHAASRQLAELAQVLAPTAGGAAGGVAVLEAGHPGDKEAVVDAVTSLLDFTYVFLIALYYSLPPAVLKEPYVPPSAQPFVAEFAEALESSQVLEHAARVLLLVLVGAAHDGGGGGPVLPPDSVRAFRRFIDVHTRFTVLSVEYCRSADDATAALGAQLRSALCGRCVTHAALVLGMFTLTSADAGSSYGLDEIVRTPAVRAVAGEYHGAATAATAVTAGSDPPRPVKDTLLVMMMQLLASSAAVPRPPALPCRRAVFSMALRVGRLDVQSGLVAAALSTVAFEVAAFQLYPLHPIGGLSAAADTGAEVELWRLGVSALRQARLWAVERQLRSYCCVVKDTWRRAEQGIEEAADRCPLRLPPSPPRPLAAALPGGLLPCIEYLLRSAGRDPAGGSWQAFAVQELAEWLGGQLASLLAYGDECEAAALVATLGKLLRRALADPRVVEGVWDPQTNFWQAVLSAVSALISDFCDCYEPSRGSTPEPAGPLDPGPKPEAAAAGGVAEAVEGPPQPAFSPASQQLPSLLSFAACHWLPPLSRLAQAALASRPLLGGDGSGSGGSGGGVSGGSGSGGGGFAPKTATYLLYASLEWVPLLATCCAPPAARRPESVAPEVTGGSNEGDGSGGDGDWRALLLEEAAVVPLLGAAQECAQELEAAGMGEGPLPPLAELLVRCRDRLAVLRLAGTVAPAAAAPSAAGPSIGGASAGFEGADGRESGGGGGSGATGPRSVASRPSVVTEAAAEAEVKGPSVGEAEDGDADGSGEAPRVPEPAVDPALLRLAWAMPPPAAARRLLRTCANPGCSSLEGDSEAELRLTPCAGCGEAAYCCRDCWTAHWRAGHRAACARRRLEGAGTWARRWSREGLPGRNEGLPGCDEGLPGRDEGLPGRDEGLPGCDEGLPGRDEGLPGRDEGLPGRDEGLPGCDEGLPGRDEGLPGRDEGLPGRDEGLATLVTSPWLHQHEQTQ